MTYSENIAKAKGEERERLIGEAIALADSYLRLQEAFGKIVATNYPLLLDSMTEGGAAMIEAGSKTQAAGLALAARGRELKELAQEVEALLDSPLKLMAAESQRVM